MKNVQNFKNTLFILTRPLPLALVTKENNCLAHHAQTVVKKLCNLLVNYIFNNYKRYTTGYRSGPKQQKSCLIHIIMYIAQFTRAARSHSKINKNVS